ncbi:hypothetical protein Q3G72_013889 [Acer saccharum]|nr:hypothetical protein Q3G72_013889 [Acer saccharum]
MWYQILHSLLRFLFFIFSLRRFTVFKPPWQSRFRLQVIDLESWPLMALRLDGEKSGEFEEIDLRLLCLDFGRGF